MRCELRRQSCGCAGSARHIARQRGPAPRLATAPSSGRTLLEAIYPIASEAANPPPPNRSAACQAAACLLPFKVMFGIAVPPKADNPRLDPTSFDRPAAANRIICARFKSRCNVTGERQHASSTLRPCSRGGLLLLRLIIFDLESDSRSKKVRTRPVRRHKVLLLPTRNIAKGPGRRA